MLFRSIGAIATKNLFGANISNFFAFCIVLIIISNISVMMMIGPRVYYAMAKDKMNFSFLGRISSRFGTPSLAIVIQIVLSISYVFIGKAEDLLQYMGFALGVFPVITVIGLIYMRYKFPNMKRPYKIPLFPVLPIIFVVLSVCMMVAGFLAWTKTSQIAVGVVCAGVPVFFVWRRMVNVDRDENEDDS